MKKTLPFPGLFAISPFFGEIQVCKSSETGVATHVFRDNLPRLGWVRWLGDFDHAIHAILPYS